MSTNLRPRFNPWPYTIIIYFVLFISLTIAGVTWISRQKNDLVRGDYYDDEIRYQEQMDRIDRTVPFKSLTSVDYDAGGRVIVISIPSGHAGAQSSGRIRLYCPSDEKMDQDVKLAVGNDGSQRIDAKNLREGLWKVRVYWTVEGRDYFFAKSVVVGPVKS
jgi:hypothetical protein